MNGERRKMSIKPFRPHVAIDLAQAHLTWEALDRAIQEIHNRNASSLSFEELYRNAYHLVLHKHGELLYNSVISSISRHLELVAVDVAHTPEDMLLNVLSEKWSIHKVTMMMIRDILMYMDRTYVVQKRKTPIYDVGLQVFYDKIVRCSAVRDRLRKLLLEKIETERNGELVDRGLIKNILSMLVDLGVNSCVVYEEEFEKDFLEVTAQFYRMESQNYLDQNTCPDYLKKVEKRISEEMSRLAHCMSPTTESKLRKIVDIELIERHYKSLIHMEGSGCIPMFRDDKVEDLRRMYTLFSRTSVNLLELRHVFYKYIQSAGEELIRTQEEVKDAVIFVDGLLKLRDKFARMVQQAFDNDNQFQKSLKDGFESFMNISSTCASYLAQHVDSLLRSGFKGMSDKVVDINLDKIVVLFRYLQDKDIFEEYYKRHLSKRLLAGRSRSDEVEKSMIAKLKAECGYQFTSKLEGMFKDMSASKEITDQFCREQDMSDCKVELNVHVLTTGNWPTNTVQKCALPAEIARCCDLFQKFYHSRHTGRQLTWQTNMGTVDLKAQFEGGRNELNVSTYQACILMLFNSAEVLSFADILEATHIPEVELSRHLISLCTPKYPILLKSSKGKIIQAQDTFDFNAKYKSKLFRVRIQLVSQKEATIVSSVPQPVEADRNHLIEASIVRIMKTRKSMPHNNLVAEVTRQLSVRFSPSPQVIKRRIESLIEREYLERSRSDRRLYNYLA